MSLNPLIIAMAVAFTGFIGIGYLWMWVLARRFDKKYGHTYTRPPGRMKKAARRRPSSMRRSDDRDQRE